MFNDAFERLKAHHGYSEDTEDDDESESDYEDPEFGRYKAIYKSSKFFQLFSNFVEKIPQDSSKPDNNFYSAAFLKLFLDKSLAFLPVWTIFLGRLVDKGFQRGNNARIERFFQGLKIDVGCKKQELGPLGKVSVAAYAAFAYERNLAKVKEVHLGVRGKKKAVVVRSAGEVVSNTAGAEKESWGKRSKTPARRSKTFLDAGKKIAQPSV
jgi:hypothetical protein